MVCTISVKKFDLQVSDHNSLFLCTQHLQLGENHRALTKMNSKETTFGMYICMGGGIFFKKNFAAFFLNYCMLNL